MRPGRMGGERERRTCEPNGGERERRTCEPNGGERERRTCEPNDSANQQSACKQCCTAIHPAILHFSQLGSPQVRIGAEHIRQREETSENSPIEAFALSSDSATALCPFTAAQWSGVLPHFIACSKALGHAISPESSDPCTSVTFTLRRNAPGQLSTEKSCPKGPRGAMRATTPKTSAAQKYFTTHEKSNFAFHHT
jgi:hypothetical protein